MFKPRRDAFASEHHPNLTPLVDVSLTLVVILLLATPLALQSSINLAGARSAGQTAPDPSRVDRVEIVLLSADSLRVNELPLPRAALAPVLAPLLAQSESRQVVVRCADAVPHGVFVSVLDEAKYCGALDIAMIGR